MDITCNPIPRLIRKGAVPFALSAIISDTLGSRNTEKAVRYQAQAVTLGIIIAAVIGIVMNIFLRSLYRPFDAEGEVFARGLHYIQFIASFGVVLALAQVLNAGLIHANPARSAPSVPVQSRRPVGCAAFTFAISGPGVGIVWAGERVNHSPGLTDSGGRIYSLWASLTHSMEPLLTQALGNT